MATFAEDAKTREENELLNEAIRFAVDRHAGQLRKGSRLPYIVHPMEVVSILAAIGADTELMIAGMLHDCIEDSDATYDEIEEKFGERTAQLVAAHSEDKAQSWNARKTKALEELIVAPPDFLRMVLADKLSNMRAMARDYHMVGDELWKRFHAPRDKQAWYYRASVEAMKSAERDEQAAPFYREFCDLVWEIFPE